MLMAASAKVLSYYFESILLLSFIPQVKTIRSKTTIADHEKLLFHDGRWRYYEFFLLVSTAFTGVLWSAVFLCIPAASGSA